MFIISIWDDDMALNSIENIFIIDLQPETFLCNILWDFIEREKYMKHSVYRLSFYYIRWFVLVSIILVSVCINSLQAQWASNGPSGEYGGNVRCLAVYGSKVLAGTASGVYVSSDNGTNWTVSNTGMSYFFTNAIVVKDSNIFCGTLGGGVYRSVDGGANWTAVSESVTGDGISLAVNSTDVYVGSYNGVVYRSTNNGVSWDSADSGLPTTSVVLCLAANSSNVYAGTYNGVYHSIDNGATWDHFGLADHMIYSLFLNGTNLYAGAYDTLFMSANNDTNWVSVRNDMGYGTCRSLAASGSKLFAATENSVYYSTNNAANWNIIDSALFSEKVVLALAVTDTMIFAGAENSGVWQRTISDITTSVNAYSAETPNGFYLQQNYPNPFNPSTVIGYRLLVNGFVTLKVYNILGKEVATLVNETKNAGSYQVTFNAGKLASGVYFYKLQAGAFTNVKKLLLMK
jgi:hypothetical protein